MLDYLVIIAFSKCQLYSALLETPGILSASLRSWRLCGLFKGSIGHDLVGRGNWRTQADVIGQGMFTDIGSHILDLMLWLGKGVPAQVASFAQSTGAPAIISALAHLDNGVLLSLAFNDAVSGGDELKFYGQGQMTFYGNRGLITADWSRLMTTEAEQIWLEQEGVRTQVEPAFETIHPAAAFVATVLDGAPNLAPAHEAAHVVALTAAAYQSAATGQVIQLER